MDENIASAMLMRLNKQDQVAALQSIGFTTVNENTPASDIAKYMQWSGTLLDLSLATLAGVFSFTVVKPIDFKASIWSCLFKRRSMALAIFLSILLYNIKLILFGSNSSHMKKG